MYYLSNNIAFMVSYVPQQTAAEGAWNKTRGCVPCHKALQPSSAMIRRIVGSCRQLLAGSAVVVKEERNVYHTREHLAQISDPLLAFSMFSMAFLLSLIDVGSASLPS